MRDLRLAIRSLRATPIVTCAAVLSLVLGIGANTSIFSLFDSLLLRPLPVARPDRLVMLSMGQTEDTQFSYALLEQLRRLDQFDGATAWNVGSKGTLTIAGDTRTVDTQFVSGEYFNLLGVPAVVGRTLLPSDDTDGGGPNGLVAMISYGLWQARFGGDPHVIGARVLVDRMPVTIIGVTPPEFFGLIVGRGFDIAMPIREQPLIQPAIPLTEDIVWLRITLRLKVGQSIEAATQALRAMQPQLRTAAAPKNGQEASTFLKDPLVLVPAGSRRMPLRERFQRPLVMLIVVVALVLLVACVNIANLMLARSAAERTQRAVRVALGASRWQLARQSLVESLILATVGAAGGIAFGRWASEAVVSQLSNTTTPVVLRVSLDWRVLIFTGVILALTTVIAGALPAARATQTDPIDALREQGRSAGSGRQGQLLGALVIAQVALSLVLVVAAGLFLRTFQHLAHAPLGFDRNGAVIVAVAAPTVPPTDRSAVFRRLAKAVADAPGVSAAGGSFNPPFVGTLIGEFVVSTPGVTPPPDAERITQISETTPGWFSAYGIPIAAGRDFHDGDTATSQPVMLVDEAFERRFLPSQTAVGTTLAVTFRMPPFGDVLLGTKTIVGVVGDSVYRSIRQPRRPTIYFAFAQRSGPLLVPSFFIAVRARAGSPLLLTRTITETLATINRDLSVSVRAVSAQVNDSLAQDRVVAMLAAFFGVLSILMAALGLYGVTAHAVAQRRGEIGIRVALGATRGGVIRLVLSRAAALVGAGIVIGTVVSVWATRLVASLLYDVQPRDPVTLAGAAALLGAVGILAGWLPAWRASRIDPAELLRES